MTKKIKNLLAVFLVVMSGVSVCEEIIPGTIEEVQAVAASRTTWRAANDPAAVYYPSHLDAAQVGYDKLVANVGVSSSCYTKTKTMQIQAVSDIYFVNLLCNGSYYADTSLSKRLENGYTCQGVFQTSPVCTNMTCPAKSSPNQQSSCTCDAGYVAENQQCVVACPAAGTSVGAGTWVAAAGSGNSACMDGCTTAADTCATAAGRRVCGGPFVFTGGRCDPADNSAPATTSEADCAKKGLGSATINGVTTCAPPESVTKSTTKTTTPTNPDGSPGTPVTETQSTTCEGGNCTTTTTQSGGGGSPGAVTQQSASSFCEENPNSPICKAAEAGIWGSGSCDSAPSCSGDAVQCAQAEEIWKLRCDNLAMTKEDAPVHQLLRTTDLGGSASELADGEAALNKNGANDIDIGEMFLAEKAKNFFSVSVANTCPSGAAVPFVIRGETLANFDFSVACQIGEFFRLIVHIVSYMTVLGLIVRSA